MSFTKVKFVAPRWKRSLADDGETVVFTADTGDEPVSLCHTVVQPVWENGTGHFEYHCEDMGCDGECNLHEIELPGGDYDMECRCE